MSTIFNFPLCASSFTSLLFDGNHVFLLCSFHLPFSNFRCNTIVSNLSLCLLCLFIMFFRSFLHLGIAAFRMVTLVAIIVGSCKTFTQLCTCSSELASLLDNHLVLVHTSSSNMHKQVISPCWCVNFSLMCLECGDNIFHNNPDLSDLMLLSVLCTATNHQTFATAPNSWLASFELTGCWCNPAAWQAIHCLKAPPWSTRLPPRLLQIFCSAKNLTTVGLKT